MSAYKDLQEEAKGLGLKYIGVSKKNLTESIVAAKNVEVVKPNPENLVEDESPEVEESKGKINTAIIRNKGHEVRRYTFDVHGKNFAKYAKEFSKDREGYKIELVEMKPSIKCPQCGGIINT